MVQKRALRTGDGSHQTKELKAFDRTGDTDESNLKDALIWGWQDPDMSVKMKRCANVINPADD